MTTALTAQARDYAAGVTVEVGPAGRLRTINLTPKSMRLGGDALAGVILDLVRTATAPANRRGRLAWPELDLDRAGIGAGVGAGTGAGAGTADAALAADLEHTTPDTWMR